MMLKHSSLTLTLTLMLDANAHSRVGQAGHSHLSCTFLELSNLLKTLRDTKIFSGVFAGLPKMCPGSRPRQTRVNLEIWQPSSLPVHQLISPDGAYLFGLSSATLSSPTSRSFFHHGFP